MAEPVGALPRPSRPPQPRTTLPWTLVAILAVAAVGLGAAVLRSQPSDQPGPPSPTVADSPETSPSPPPPETPDVMPLRSPDHHFPESGVSAIPAPEGPLEDGDYFGFLRGIDAGARTVDVDIAIFYTGQPAIDWLEANQPDAMIPPPSDHLIVNQSERVRTLTLATDVVIWTWCWEPDGALGRVQRDVPEWATAPNPPEPVFADHTCDAEPLAQQPDDLFWFDVRNGAVAQIVGQFLS